MKETEFMAAQMNFRAAINGFNRDDVVHYIEYLNAKHMAEVNQLNSELEFLRSKSESEPVVPAVSSNVKEENIDPTLEEQAARIRELFDENKELKAQLEEIKAEKAQLECRLADAQAQKENCRASRMEEELEAYRRAERAERMAQERADQLYRQANGVLADATAKVDESADRVDEMADRVLAQLKELQTTVAGSKQVLRDAAAAMGAIHPEHNAE